MELISVIVPVYNLERYLEPSVESILAQTYQNIEIILVDDGSTDSSGEICDRFAASDSRVRVIHKKNGGVSSARNAGLDAARGSLIGFVDGDDRIHPDMYLELHRAVTTSGADIAHCGLEMISEKVLEHGHRWEIKRYPALDQWDRDRGMRELLSGSVQPSVWNKLYRAELFDGVRFDEKLATNEDFWANYALFKKTRSSVYLDSPLYAYVKRSGSCTMSGFGDKQLQTVAVAQWALDDIRKTVPELVPYGRKRYVGVTISAYNHSFPMKRYHVLRKNIRAEFRTLRSEAMHNPYISKTQKLAVWGITAVPALYHVPLFIRWCYRQRNRI